MTGARGFEILAWQVCQEMGLRGRCGYWAEGLARLTRQRHEPHIECQNRNPGGYAHSA